ncbi:MAG: M23 family metallopeptidase [Clostridia bacterium]|nr:M23 family metallopeptidase [Clostridia bacterium]
MNKEKLSKILEQYSNFLKRYGVYLLIILFIFSVSLNYFLGKDKEPELSLAPDLIPVADVTVEESGPEVVEAENEVQPQEEEMKTDPEEAVQQLEIVPVESTMEDNTQKNIAAETIEINLQANETAEENEETGAFSFIWPVKGKVIKKYGLSYSELYGDYRLYPGIDIEVDSNTGVSAAKAGKVVLVEETKGSYTVEIDHGQDYLTHYSNLNQVQVKEGQRVKDGEIIGQVNTYLHFRVKQKDHWTDPNNYLTGES